MDREYLGTKCITSKCETVNYTFEKIDTREKAYCIGFILANSSITKDKHVEIAAALEDKSVIDFIARVINGTVYTDMTFDKKTRRFPRVRCTKKITDIATFTGGLKKEDRRYPIVSPDLERYLIQGFFDGDGCLTFGRRKDRNRVWQKISFTSQYKLLIGIQKYLLHKLSISSSINVKSGNEKCYVLEFSDKSNVLKFLNNIYPDDNFIVLMRKYIKYNALRLELGDNGEPKRNTVPSPLSGKV